MEWCPFASRRPISRNFWPDRDGHVPVIIVDHVADGYHSPFGWFDADRPDPTSAHFWISRIGELEQYVPLTGAAWANGPMNNPDLSVPVIVDAFHGGLNPNKISVSVEHEGLPTDSLTDSQFAVSRKLHEWLAETFAIPWDRHHIVGHYQIDSVTRANCPGPKFPWGPILTLLPPTETDVFNLTDDDKAELLKATDAIWSAAESLKSIFAKYGPRGASVGSWVAEGAKAQAVISKEMCGLNSQ